MKPTNLVMTALVAAGLLAAGAPLRAQQPGMGMRDMPMGPGMMMGPGGMMGMMRMMGDCPMMGMMMGADTSTFAEGRIAFLKAELAITDAQKAAWETYAAALKNNLQGMQAMRENMAKVMEAKTPVERLDAHIAAMPPCLSEGGEAGTGCALRRTERRSEEEGRSAPHRHGLHDVKRTLGA